MPISQALLGEIKSNIELLTTNSLLVFQRAFGLIHCGWFKIGCTPY